MDTIITGYFVSPIGTLRIQHSGNGICSLIFTDDVLPEINDSAQLDNCKQQLREYFNATRKEFELELDPTGTEFQKKIWKSLCLIRFGQTISYSGLASMIGNPHSVRAVANANAVNPISIIIPCHRVIGSDGNLTGYAGGLWRKKWLLDHEHKHRQLSLF